MAGDMFSPWNKRLSGELQAELQDKGAGTLPVPRLRVWYPQVLILGSLAEQCSGQGVGGDLLPLMGSPRSHSVLVSHPWSQFSLCTVLHTARSFLSLGEIRALGLPPTGTGPFL